MAVLPERPGLKVEAFVQGRHVQEYNDDNEEDSPPKAVTKYVEAQSGANFSVVATFKAPFSTQHDVMMRVIIDGKPMAKWLCRRRELSNKVVECEGIRRETQEGWVKQSFCFAELEIVEEVHGPAPNVADLRRDLSAKGCITVSFEFIDGVREMGIDRSRSRRHRQLAPLKDIPEKALKGDALSHQALLSKPRRTHPSVRKHRTYSVVDKEPFATFHFKYRSLASLKALRLITVDETTPVPLEDKPEEELSPAEMRELLRRMRQREAENDIVKQETEARARVKREQTVDDDDEITIVETRSRNRPREQPEVIVID